jgi:hypothetical protein
MTVLVIKIVLQPELPLIRHNLLHEPGLKDALYMPYMDCTYVNYIHNM